MKYALHESLKQDVWQPLLGDTHLRALVVKPAIVGRLKAVLQIQQAAGPGVEVVLSSAFETGIALSQYAVYASVL
eukprot:2266053-Rhodomonas_salina.1